MSFDSLYTAIFVPNSSDYLALSSWAFSVSIFSASFWSACLNMVRTRSAAGSIADMSMRRFVGSSLGFLLLGMAISPSILDYPHQCF